MNMKMNQSMNYSVGLVNTLIVQDNSAWYIRCRVKVS